MNTAVYMYILSTDQEETREVKTMSGLTLFCFWHLSFWHFPNLGKGIKETQNKTL